MLSGSMFTSSCNIYTNYRFRNISSLSFEYRSKENLCHNVITYIFISHVPLTKIYFLIYKSSKNKEHLQYILFERTKKFFKQKSSTIILLL